MNTETAQKEMIDGEWEERDKANRSVDPEKLKHVADEMAAVVDDCLTVRTFEFLHSDGSESNFLFPDQWRERWLAVLEPGVKIIERQIEQYQKTIEAVLPESEEMCFAWRSLDDSRFDQMKDAEEFGFRVGVLVGAKMMGASRERLMVLARGMVKTILLQPRFTDR